MFSDYEGLFRLLMERKRLKPATAARKLTELRRFLTFLAGKKQDVKSVEAGMVEEYFIFLEKRGYSVSTRSCAAATVRDLYCELDEKGLLVVDPMEQVELVFREAAGRKKVLSEDEMFAFLESIPAETGLDVRDRALFEVLYVTGMRGGEVIGLDPDHVDLAKNEVIVRRTKTGKDRIVPFGRKAKEHLELWMKKYRPWYAGTGVPAALFLSVHGRRLTISALGSIFRKRARAVGLEGKGYSPHSIRHSCATHLLANGADIRYVQELLGHDSIETTVTYTQGVVNTLKKMHKTCHPRENEIYEELTQV